MKANAPLKKTATPRRATERSRVPSALRALRQLTAQARGSRAGTAARKSLTTARRLPSKLVGGKTAKIGAPLLLPDEGSVPANQLPMAKVVSPELPPRLDAKPLPAPADPAPVRQPYDENSGLRLYLRDAVATELLTPAQEVELAGRIQAGDDEAREHMIKANLRLVVKIAREYEDFGLPLLDLINEGNIGLMRAVERFDPNKGAKLSTYAAWWIKQSIKRALSNQSKSIRLPIHIVQELARMRRAEARLEAELGHPPTDAELAAELEADVEDIKRWREAAAIGATSLDAPLGNDADASRVADVIADENAVMPWAGVSEETNSELIHELVKTLNTREQRILRERFALDGGDPKTLEEIGADFGLTRERIRQLEAAALRKLRQRFLARESSMQLAA